VATQIDTAQRQIVVVKEARIRPMMGNQVLESLPLAGIPYSMVDPYILVHEATVRITPEQANQDTIHPHRGFDNIWYAISGSSSTGHSTGPGGTMERAKLEEGSLLKVRTGRGVLHAEGLGKDELAEGKIGTEMRGLLFWVNLARKHKNVEPTAQVVQRAQLPIRREGDATVRTLVGEGSPVTLGTPGLILDVDLTEGGAVTISVDPSFNGFVYLLEGKASFGANRSQASRSQIAVLGPVASSPSRMHSPGHGSCSWRGNRTARPPSTTDRTSTDGAADITPGALRRPEFFLSSARAVTFVCGSDLRADRSNHPCRLTPEQHQEPASLHPRDGDAQGHDQELDRNRRGECSPGHDRRELLAHEDGNRQRQPGNGQSGDRSNQRHLGLVSTFAPSATGEPAAANLDSAQQQDDAQDEFGELQQGGKEDHVRQDQSFDQAGKDPTLGAWIRADELIEILYVVRIGELIEARQNELDAKGGLDERRGGECSVPAGGKPATAVVGSERCGASKICFHDR